jgi:hypothetical protein
VPQALTRSANREIGIDAQRIIKKLDCGQIVAGASDATVPEESDHAAVAPAAVSR